MKTVFQMIFALAAIYALGAVIVSLVMIPIGDWLFWVRYGGASLVLLVVCKICIMAIARVK